MKMSYTEILERVALLKKKIEIAEQIIEDANKSIETYEAELDILLADKTEMEDPAGDDAPTKGGRYPDE